MLTRLTIALAASLIAGAALAGPPPPVAQGPVLAGDISVALGIAGAGSTVGIFSANGRVNMPLSNPGWNLEVEIPAAAIFQGGDSEASAGVAAHLWGMHQPNSAWGVFGAVAFGNDLYWTAGVEAKHFVPKGSWAVSAGVVAGSYIDTVGAFTASLNHYLNPNHRFGLRAAILTDFSDSLWEVGGDIERRFAHPISIFAAASVSGGTGPTIYTGKVGVRFFLDSPADTLQSHERKVPWTIWAPEALLFQVSG